MLIQCPPTSSTERVREFRARNPGYDRRWKRGRGTIRQARLTAHAATHPENPAKPIAGGAFAETFWPEAAAAPAA
jgi:hypothetical protein